MRKRLAINKAHPTNLGSRLPNDRGQTILFVLLALGLFLLAAITFGVDVANFWFHRQAAQGAADAACTAGVMDILSNANTGGTRGGFTAGTDFDCSSATTAVPCQYAALNGYDGKNTSPGNKIEVSFPGSGSVPGIDPGAIPATGLIPNPFMRVIVTDHVQTFFSGLLTGNKTQDVPARATCAVLKAEAPIPLIILNPTCSDTFVDSGSGSVAIVGGPGTSIQTNSSDPNGVSVTGSGSIDLSQGGPNFTGSDMAVLGGPASAPSGFNGGTTGGWSFPSTPISDPFALLPAPSVPIASLTDGVTKVAPIKVTVYPDPVYGCPDHSGCDVYLPGLYTHPIVVKNRVAVFVPGLYYFNIPVGGFNTENCGTPGGCIAKPKGQCNYALAVDSNGMVRMSTAAGDGSGGVTFYFSGPGGAGGYGSAFFGSNAGKSPGSDVVDPYSTSGVACPGAPAPNPKLNLPPTVTGDVLLAPCTQDGTYFSSPTNGSTIGPVRGLIIFDDRANGNNDGQPSMQGGGGLVIAGTMYVHNCPKSTTTGCVPGTDYKAFLQFQGTPGSGTFLLGNITADEFITAGNGALSMQLDSARVFTILKATMVQ